LIDWWRERERERDFEDFEDFEIFTKLKVVIWTTQSPIDVVIFVSVRLRLSSRDILRIELCSSEKI